MITLEKLKEVLHYNPETGIWTWLVDKNKNMKGKQAGCIDKDGYICIKIDYKQYMAHRLAWFYMTGEWPKEEIDHVNTIELDNRWINLREANDRQQKQNQGKSKNNTTGFKGVSLVKTKKAWKSLYRAAIGINGKRITLGYRKTPEEAFELYKNAALKYYGNFANLGD